MTARFSRRSFLAAMAASAVIPPASVAASPITLSSKAVDIQLLPEGYGLTTVWAYDGSSPGPEIRLLQGARLERRLRNELPQPTSTHWHGVRINNVMDGVAGFTQDAIMPGESFDYEFTAPDAGTFWYHAHNRSFEQIARGLYGALIVEEPDQIDIDKEEVLILDDWLIDPESAQLAESFGAMHDLSHAGRIGNYVTTNGVYNLTRDVRRHERLRLRLINAANARIFELGLDGLDGWIVAQDGMPLLDPSPISGAFLMGPAQRLDLIVDVTGNANDTAHLVQFDRGKAFSQVAFQVKGEASLTRREKPTPLPPNPYAMPDLSSAMQLVLRMEGGAMGGMRGALMGGRPTSMTSLAQAGKFWAFNGAIGGIEMPPLAELDLGETVRLKIINNTAFPHAMHLHGMHFHEVAPDGTIDGLRDTTLLMRGETQEIVFVADNPGDWLLHCHMVSHAESGMMTWVRVT